MNYAKREVTHFGGKDEPSVSIEINVYGHNALMPNETKAAADDIAERVMLVLKDARHIHANLSKIQVKSRRK